MMAQVIQGLKDLGVWEAIQLMILIDVVFRIFNRVFNRD